MYPMNRKREEEKAMRTMPVTLDGFRLLAATAACTVLLSSGCATIAHGRYQRIQVETDPPAARVSVEGTQRRAKGVLQFETPGEVVVDRKEKRVVLRIEKAGYETAEVALHRGASPWTPIGFAGSVGGLGVWVGMLEAGVGAGMAVGAVYGGIGVGIDLLTGSAFRLHPSRVSLTLQPKQDSPPGTASDSTVQPE